MFKSLLQYFDLWFFVRFAGLFFVLYLGYTFIIAVSAPTGTYYPFVDHYLNFPVVLRYCILHIGQGLLGILGYASTVSGDQIISVEGHSILQMAWPCYGLGVQSVWIAFVCAHKLSIKQKIGWSTGGVFTIFFINCLRVTLLMIAMVDRWTIADTLGTNAHDLFNYLCYFALIGLILLFYKKVKTHPVTPPIPITSL